MEILFIYANGCPDCERMKDFLNKAIASTNKEIKVKQISSITKEAIDTAIEHGIEDLPSCVIGDKIFQGKYFEYESMVEAIRYL